MKMFVCALVASAALIGLAEGPVVSNVSLVQSAENGLVEITYDLAGSDAVVTLEIQEEVGGVWKTLTGEAFTDDFAGDAAVKVSVGTGKKVFWRPAIAGTVSARKYRPVLTAYPTDNPPDYMGVDLASGALRFYSNSNTVPYGVKSRFWKLDRMLMRKIPAKGVVWRMGSPTTEKWRTANEEYPHKVRLTYDYYMAVYELTCRQSYMLSGYWHNVSTDGEQTPPASVDEQVMPSGYWDLGPLQQSTNSKNPLIVLWSQTGVPSFDVPSEAEWEYACRGGTGTSCYGGNVTEWTADSAVNKTGARYNISTTAEVGYSKPNAFGLYDTIGNVYEWCRDPYTRGADYTATFADGWEDGAVTENPEGPTTPVKYSGEYHYTYRGGCASKSDGEVGHACRAAQRNERYLWRAESSTLGLRLMCRAEDVIK